MPYAQALAVTNSPSSRTYIPRLVMEPLVIKRSVKRVVVPQLVKPLAPARPPFKARRTRAFRALPDFTNSLISKGRIHLHELLGKGSFGAVYRATTVCIIDDSLIPLPAGTQLAVKIIRKQPANSRGCYLLHKELDLHSLVSGHNNVLTLHGHLKDTEFHYLLLTYCAGMDLYQQIRRPGLFAKSDVLCRRVVLQLIDAVGACHAKDVYHRDLKPENIFFGSDWDSLVVGDFGLASHALKAHDWGTGSAPYMAPEISDKHYKTYAAKHGFRNDKVDIWALGVIIINVVTGRSPWRRSTSSDRYFQVYLHNPRVFFRRRLPISRDLDFLLQRVFTLNPALRPTLKEMRKAIEKMPTLALTTAELARATSEVRDVAGEYADLDSEACAWLSGVVQRDTIGNKLAVTPDPTVAVLGDHQLSRYVYRDSVDIRDRIQAVREKLDELPELAGMEEVEEDQSRQAPRFGLAGPPPLHQVSSKSPLVIPGFDDNTPGTEHVASTTIEQPTAPAIVHVRSSTMVAQIPDEDVVQDDHVPELDSPSISSDVESVGPATPQTKAAEPDVEVPDIDAENGGVDLAGAVSGTESPVGLGIRGFDVLPPPLNNKKRVTNGGKSFKTMVETLRKIPAPHQWKRSPRTAAVNV